ncbi:uncharacterized protein [Eurosta solidaginis]|uniref:uncharacterized protein n=1 Tax=Eurosta solidaginis TaxID=178769 RepID=UPI003530D483
MNFNRFFESATDDSPITKNDLEEFGKKILDHTKASEQKMLKETHHNEKSVKRTMTRILQETKQRTNHSQKRRSNLLLKTPFNDLEKFQNFEKEVQDHGSKYENLKDELSTVMAHTGEKFVRNAWRKILTDGVAQQLC